MMLDLTTKMKQQEGWAKLKSDEIQEILDFEVEGEQYRIQCHCFSNGKLHLVINDRISDKQKKIDAVEYKCDFPHVLAIDIFKKKLHGISGKSSVQWADNHFK